MDFSSNPIFSGTDPEAWISVMERSFFNCRIRPPYDVEFAMRYLDGEALTWARPRELLFLEKGWCYFVHRLLWEFATPYREDLDDVQRSYAVQGSWYGTKEIAAVRTPTRDSSVLDSNVIDNIMVESADTTHNDGSTVGDIMVVSKGEEVLVSALAAESPTSMTVDESSLHSNQSQIKISVIVTPGAQSDDYVQSLFIPNDYSVNTSNTVNILQNLNAKCWAPADVESKGPSIDEDQSRVHFVWEPGPVSETREEKAVEHNVGSSDSDSALDNSMLQLAGRCALNTLEESVDVVSTKQQELSNDSHEVIPDSVIVYEESMVDAIHLREQQIVPSVVGNTACLTRYILVCSKIKAALADSVPVRDFAETSSLYDSSIACSASNLMKDHAVVSHYECSTIISHYQGREQLLEDEKFLAVCYSQIRNKTNFFLDNCVSSLGLNKSNICDMIYVSGSTWIPMLQQFSQYVSRDICFDPGISLKKVEFYIFSKIISKKCSDLNCTALFGPVNQQFRHLLSFKGGTCSSVSSVEKNFTCETVSTEYDYDGYGYVKEDKSKLISDEKGVGISLANDTLKRKEVAITSDSEFICKASRYQIFWVPVSSPSIKQSNFCWEPGPIKWICPLTDADKFWWLDDRHNQWLKGARVPEQLRAMPGNFTVSFQYTSIVMFSDSVGLVIAFRVSNDALYNCPGTVCCPYGTDELYWRQEYFHLFHSALDVRQYLSVMSPSLQVFLLHSDQSSLCLNEQLKNHRCRLHDWSYMNAISGVAQCVTMGVNHRVKTENWVLNEFPVHSVFVIFRIVQFGFGVSDPADIRDLLIGFTFCSWIRLLSTWRLDLILGLGFMSVSLFFSVYQGMLVTLEFELSSVTFGYVLAAALTHSQYMHGTPNGFAASEKVKRVYFTFMGLHRDHVVRILFDTERIIDFLLDVDHHQLVQPHTPVTSGHDIEKIAWVLKVKFSPHNAVKHVFTNLSCRILVVWSFDIGTANIGVWKHTSGCLNSWVDALDFPSDGNLLHLQWHIAWYFQQQVSKMIGVEGLTPLIHYNFQRHWVLYVTTMCLIAMQGQFDTVLVEKSESSGIIEVNTPASAKDLLWYFDWFIQHAAFRRCSCFLNYFIYLLVLAAPSWRYSVFWILWLVTSIVAVRMSILLLWVVSNFIPPCHFYATTRDMVWTTTWDATVCYETWYWTTPKSKSRWITVGGYYGFSGGYIMHDEVVISLIFFTLGCNGQLAWHRGCDQKIESKAPLSSKQTCEVATRRRYMAIDINSLLKQECRRSLQLLYVLKGTHLLIPRMDANELESLTSQNAGIAMVGTHILYYVLHAWNPGSFFLGYLWDFKLLLVVGVSCGIGMLPCSVIWNIAWREIMIIFH